MPQIEFSIYDDQEGEQLSDILDILGPDWGKINGKLLKFNPDTLHKFV